ncbi:ABC transporter substrate-binding protein [bacterium]|nr:ABC transporter substrate-binding protein [bacterium]
MLVGIPLLAIVLAYILTYLQGCQARGNAIVVYCAHDSVYSEKVLWEFSNAEQIAARPVFDTEATKSLGLVERLIREKDAPRCDVFWNNQLLGTLSLQQRGILQPCKGAGWQRIPEPYRDPDGHWAGFGARFRVWIVNTEKMKATPEAVAEALAADDLRHVAIAKPLYGTTLTHYSVLWHHWGAEKLKAWHRDWRRRGVTEATGNAHVKDLVAAGVCRLGLTDTDDFFVAADEGKPVAMVPFRLDNGATLCIPNTVAVIHGTSKPDAARKLVDYLLSEATELALARSKARQVPLGPVDESQLGADVRALKGWVKDGYPLGGLAPARAACLAWLKSEYVR